MCSLRVLIRVLHVFGMFDASDSEMYALYASGAAMNRGCVFCVYGAAWSGPRGQGRVVRDCEIKDCKIRDCEVCI